MKKQLLWVSVLLILLLLVACGAEPEVAEPTEFRVACFGCKERFTSGQLNADFGLCQDCMMKVGAAYCRGCEKPCYTRDMVHGLCTTCNAALEETTAEPETTVELETTTEPETTVAVDMVNCNLCGRPIARSEAKRGFCPGCYAQVYYQEDERNFATCDVCGIMYGYSDPLVCGICQDCWGEGYGPAGVCRMCGKDYSEDGEGFEGLCYSCQDKYGPKCSVCGDDLTYQGGIEGMCYACYDAANSCKKCGTDITSQNYDGYCYYCHPSFGYTCVRCGNEWPAHRPESGLCGLCQEKCALCDSGVYKDGYCYYCHPDFTWYCVICGSQNPDYGPADKICNGCREKG